MIRDIECPTCEKFADYQVATNELNYLSCKHCNKDFLYAEGLADNIKKDSDNNGGSTDYYKLNPQWKDAMDIVEDREMNYSQGNIFKVAMTFNIGRHTGTDEIRELNKIIYFTEREIARIKEDKMEVTGL